MKKNDKKKVTHTHTHRNVKNKDYTWQITSVVLLALLVVASIFAFSGLNRDGVDVSCNEDVGKDTQSFLMSEFQLPELILKETIEEKNLCLHKFEIQGTDIDIYTSYDGDILFIPGLEPIKKSTYDNGESETQELQKSEKPVVELFVMSHCPYGTQAEKGILPVVDLLGDAIDFELKFVNYVMRNSVEINEQLLQYCIQKESKEKLKEYLYCFLEDGESESCVKEIDISKDSLDSCILSTDEKYKITEMYNDKSTWLSDRYPLFLIHDQENKEYGVQGSPTLVINGSVVNSARSPQALLDSICNAFEDKPSECDQTLSTNNPSAGFGFEGVSTTSSDATCG